MQGTSSNQVTLKVLTLKSCLHLTSSNLSIMGQAFLHSRWFLRQFLLLSDCCSKWHFSVFAFLSNLGSSSLAVASFALWIQQVLIFFFFNVFTFTYVVSQSGKETSNLFYIQKQKPVTIHCKQWTICSITHITRVS